MRHTDFIQLGLGLRFVQSSVSFCCTYVSLVIMDILVGRFIFNFVLVLLLFDQVFVIELSRFLLVYILSRFPRISYNMSCHLWS
jgi:hypothetical protein